MLAVPMSALWSD